MKTWFTTIVAATAALLAPVGAAFAQNYPTRPIRMIVPFPAGGAGDVLARVVGQKMQDNWGQTVIVDNRPGGNTIIASDVVAKAAPDGYTILSCWETVAINVTLYNKLPYDQARDFAPVSLTASLPLLLMANNALPAASVKELVALAKAKPGQINFASFGTGSSSHLAGELFMSMAGIKMVHVPYKGAPPAITDLIGGQVQIFFSGLPPGMPFVKEGKAKGLAVTSAKRTALLPDVPTMQEAGMAGYEAISWSGMMVPAGTPRDVVGKLNGEFTRILSLPDVRERLAGLGFDPLTSTPEQFQTFLRAETAKWAKVVRDSGAKLD
jgi:tripartite-type tricarboxylate transporter receptor subunit TctC